MLVVIATRDKPRDDFVDAYRERWTILRSSTMRTDNRNKVVVYRDILPMPKDATRNGFPRGRDFIAPMGVPAKFANVT